MNTEQTSINVFMYTLNFVKLNIQKKRSLHETFKKYESKCYKNKQGEMFQKLFVGK